MDRYPYNLSSYCAVCGEMGRLQTLQVIPVTANDSMDIAVQGFARLSQLRRALSLDVKVDMFAFFVPHRMSLGDEWKQMVMEGAKSDVVMPWFQWDPDEGDHHVGYLPLGALHFSGPIPSVYVRGYNLIWNQYFRIPNGALPEKDLDYFPDSNSTERNYGFVCARLPVEAVAGSSIISEDALRDVGVDTTGGTFDLMDLARAQARYKSDVDRVWFAQRYRDVLQESFGTSHPVNIDADERPELIYHHQDWLSGYDVDGTSGDSFGDYTGKSQGAVTWSVPRKYFDDHGMLFFMVLLRWPTIFNTERHFLASVDHMAEPSYAKYTNDPLLLNTEPPHEYFRTDFFSDDGGTNGTMGYHPYGWWARSQPNNVHPNFQNVAGYPFLDVNHIGDSLADIQYSGSGYDMFSTQILGHWHMIAKVGCEALRIVPPASRSLNAGVNHTVLHS